jgi:protein TonB
MKTIEKAFNPAVHAEDLEDIVFEGRNQAYGAYSLRRTYNTHINLSMLVVLSLASLIALIALLRAMHQPPMQKEPDKGKTVVYFNPEKPEDLMPQLPIVEVPKNIAKTAVYTLPTVIGDVTEDDPHLMDEPFVPPTETSGLSGDIELIPIGTDTNTGIVDPPKEPWEVTEPPVFDGDFRDWLAKHITYSNEAVANGIFGTVTLKFAIDEEGNVSDITILKGIHPLIDEAVVKALKLSPKWTPGKLNGNKVKVFYYLPVKFNIQSSI